MKEISVLIAETQSDILQELRELVSNNRKFNLVDEVRDGSRLVESVRTHKPEVLILSKELVDSKNSSKDGFEYCRLISAESPSTIIVITSPYEEPLDLRNSMNAGARDFVPQRDFRERLISSIVELVSTLRKYDFSSHEKEGHIISLISPKGGVGKTTIAYNLAGYLAKNVKDAKVALVDFDLQFGDIYYLANIKPNRTIADLNEVSNIDIDLMESMLETSTDGLFDILSAPKKPHYAEVIKSSTLERILQVLQKNYDYVIVDCAQGLQKSSLTAVDKSDMVCIVGIPDLTGLKNTKLTLEALNDYLEGRTEGVCSIKLIMNLVDKRNSIPIEEVAKRLKIEVIGSIPKNETVVVNANNYNKYIFEANANSDVAKAIGLLINKINASFKQQEITNEDEDKPKEKSSIFGKLFLK